MPEDSTQTAGNTATDASDEGVSFGGGSPMDWSWIGDMVDAGIETQHQAAAFRQGVRGHDPCIYFASIDELWATDFGPKWWRATTAANKVAWKLERAITESIGSRGRHSQAATETPLADFLMDQIGAGLLIPQLMRDGLGWSAFFSQGVTAAFAPSLVYGFVESHLPRRSDLLAGGVSSASKGLEIAAGVYLWAPGLPSNPTNENQRRQLREQGRYIGPLISEQVDEWIGLQRDRVVPVGFLSARTRLINLVGTWEGSGEWGVWHPRDGYMPGSRIGYLDDWYATFWAEREEAKAICRGYGGPDQGGRGPEGPEGVAMGAKVAFVVGLAAVAAWAFGK